MGSNTASSTIKAKKDLKQFVKENKSGFGIYNEHSKILTRNENYFLVMISMGVAGHGRAGLHSDHAGWGGTRHPLLGARRGGPVRPPAARPLHRGTVVIYFATFFFVIHTFRYVRYSSIRILSPGILLMSILYMYCTVLSGKSLFYCNSLLKLHITNISLYRSVDRVIASNLHQR